MTNLTLSSSWQWERCLSLSTILYLPAGTSIQFIPTICKAVKLRIRDFKRDQPSCQSWIEVYMRYCFRKLLQRPGKDLESDTLRAQKRVVIHRMSVRVNALARRPLISDFRKISRFIYRELQERYPIVAFVAPEAAFRNHLNFLHRMPTH